MRLHHNGCCGIDVHKKSVTACRMWGPADREPQFEIRRFGTMRQAGRMAEAGVVKRRRWRAWDLTGSRYGT
jgi:hypothetical protein